MDDHKIALLETTFAEVRASQETAAALFYERLFVNDPSLRRLFTGSDMSAQGRKLMAALALAVNSLRKLDALVPCWRALPSGTSPMASSVATMRRWARR